MNPTTEDPDKAAPEKAPVVLSPTLEIASYIGVGLAMVCAMYFSGWSMWHTIEDKFGLAGQPQLIVPMFLLFDLAGMSCGIITAWSMRTRGRRGFAYVLVWAFSCGSGLMSATDGHNLTAQVMRFFAPVIVAVLFELLLAIKQHAVTGREGLLLRVLNRVRAYLGWSAPKSNTEVARSKVVGQLATSAYRLHQLPEGKWRRRRAERAYLKRLRRAVERFNIGSDQELIRQVRAGVAVLHGAIAQTSPDSVVDANPWTAPAISVAVVPPRVRRAEVRTAAARNTGPEASQLPVGTSGGSSPAAIAATTTASSAAIAVVQDPTIRPETSGRASGEGGNVIELAGRQTGGSGKRRPAEETWALYCDLVEKHPGQLQQWYAEQLQIGDRNLRAIQARFAPKAAAES